jgi:hypothetical protein
MCPSKSGINHSVVRAYVQVFRANRKPIVILSGITLATIIGLSAGKVSSPQHDKHPRTVLNEPALTPHDELYSVHLNSSGTGWAVGKFGRILRTPDGVKPEIESARTLGCYALHSTYCSYRRDAVKALVMAEAALELSNDHGFLHWIALGSFNKGWSLCNMENVKNGFPILEAVKMWKDMGAEMALPTFQVLLAEIYQSTRNFQESLRAIAVWQSQRAIMTIIMMPSYTALKGNFF